MDGVMADVYAHFTDLHEEETGIRKTLEEINGKTESQAFENARRYVTTAGFFRNNPVMEGSQAALFALDKKYDLYIVSAAMEFPLSLYEKHQWLNEHFSFITWQQMCFCGSKKIIQGDIMIDDYFKNLDHFTGTTLLFNQPHNALEHPKHHKRVSGWKEIMEIL